MQALIFTKKDCPYCVRAKALLATKNVSFTESVIGEDMLRETFMEMYPNQRTVPLILIDGQQVGGYDQLVEYFNNKPQFLAG